MKAGSAAKLIVNAPLQRFLTLARRRIETAQAQQPNTWNCDYRRIILPENEAKVLLYPGGGRNSMDLLLLGRVWFKDLGRDLKRREKMDGQYLRPSDPAYEQVLDSLAMVARHTPVPLLEALLTWRESECPKGANDASTFQRKLAVECIFCSACIRFVECCPQEGLTAALLLDLVAQFLGAFVSNQVKTEGGLNASASFVAKANPLNRAPHKRKSELHHALCNLLSHILAPLADGGKGQWPPSGVEPARTFWYEALARIRGQLMHWMDKQSKHIAIGYPLVTLLCLGDPNVFLSNFGSHMEQLYKHLRVSSVYDIVGFVMQDKNHRFMALDCLHRVLRFYLTVHGDSQPPNRDVQHDKIVEFCVTIAEHNLDFTMNHMILELLKPDSPCEAKVIGLRALLAIVMSPSSQHVGLEILHGHNIGHYIPKGKAAIELILRSCHRIYSQALLTSSRTTIDAVTKEKSQGYLFRSVLKCIPYLIEDVGRSDKITEIIPQHGISIDPGVREEAVHTGTESDSEIPSTLPSCSYERPTSSYGFQMSSLFSFKLHWDAC
ncbi:unnamed protein product [Camellia sinensis]